MTTAFFHFAGISPVLTERLKIIYNGLIRCCAVFFINIAGSKSGVCDTEFFSCLIADKMSECSIVGKSVDIIWGFV